MKQLCIFLLLGLMVPFVFGQQELTTDNQKARKFFEKAREAYHSRQYEKALQYASKALYKDSAFLEAYLVSAEIQMHLDNDRNAKQYLRKAIAIDTGKYPIAHKWLGNIAYRGNHFEKAVSYYEQYLSYKEDPKVAKKIKEAEFRKKFYDHPDTLAIRNLGSGVNSMNCEFVNAITLDNSELYYTVKPQNTPNKRFENRTRDEDFFYSIKKDSQWVKPRPVGSSINTSFNEGAMHLSSDGTYLYFTSCRGMEGYGSCDIYFAERINDTVWGRSYNLGSTINTRYWETQPCFAADGKTLYFVSSRSGGKGGADIWKATQKDDGSWSKPENLGETINTSGEDMAPYLHPDGETLYFSSDGHKGLGGSDIFMSRRIGDSAWSEPENLGYPINNNGDQINMIVDAAGTKAFISSRDSTSMGCYDIYSFTLPDEYRPEKVSYLKGYVYDAKSKKPLKATLELVELESGKTVVTSESRKDNGRFMVALPTGREYALHVHRKGYLFYSEHFSFINKPAEPMEKDIPLQPVRLNASEQLNNIFFAFDSDSLIPKSRSELDRLLNFMKQNRGLEIEIQGHTDSIGTAAYNKELSRQRAIKVYEYLADNSVPQHRMTVKGFGEEQPVATNQTEEGRARNRRTEIKITAILNE
ncbi:MAG: OmpA family protein [Bacteroidales bacterium]|nr:OmpA family protein [Bacteroidales bacterium]